MSATVESAQKSLVRRLIESFYNAREPGALSDIVGGGGDFFRTAVAVFLDLSALPDYDVAIDDLVEEGDAVAARLTIRGTHDRAIAGIQPTGRHVVVTMIALFRVSGGKIVDGWQGWDREALLEQLTDAGAAPHEPLLELDQIQGNIIPGFRKDHEILLFLAIDDADRARAWLRVIEPRIATSREVLDFNRLFSKLRARRQDESAVAATWVNVALTYNALQRLAPDAGQFADEPFRVGMAARTKLLGDAVKPGADGDPSGWVVGGPAAPVDAVVIVASDDEDDLGREVERIRASLNGLHLVFEQEGATLPAPLTGHEHFGFADGISQPAIRGFASSVPGDVVSPRRNPDDPNDARPGEALVWPGEFVFGYPRQDPADTVRPGPIAADAPTWARNGSLLVFRRYRQDVGRFTSFVNDALSELQYRGPAFAGLTAEALAAKFVGRWRSGAPLSRAPEQDNAALATDECANNNFVFEQARLPINATARDDACADATFPPAPADPRGERCPVGAHIRKTNQRDLAPDIHTHRVLRRGIPFGAPPPANEDRGLLFLCYQTSIERQFEHVLRSWSNDPDYATNNAGIDPVIGGGVADATFALSAVDGNGNAVTTDLEMPLDWTIVTGGEYFFVPSIAALRHLGA